MRTLRGGIKDRNERRGEREREKWSENEGWNGIIRQSREERRMERIYI